MFPNGLVILTQPVSALRAQIPRLLDQIASLVSNTIYIHLQPAVCNSKTLHSSLVSPQSCTKDIQLFISDIYGLSSSRCQDLDIRILLTHITNKPASPLPCYKLEKPLSVLLSDAPCLVDAWKSDRASMLQLLQQSFSDGISDSLLVQALESQSGGDSSESDIGVADSNNVLTTYDYVVLGGTFDRLHSGHRKLLSQSSLFCEKKILIGVTDEAMIARKTLKELISPYKEREASATEYVQEVKPSIEVEAVPITDLYGPTVDTVCSDYQCLVVSQETYKGAAMINDEREKRGLKRMDVLTIDLVEDTCHAPEEEEKVSSSSQRRRLLGTLLRPPPSRKHLAPRPYRIGLTGGIASGKSNMCKELERLGAAIINCDLLGHEAYAPGTKGFDEVVAEFGSQLVTEKGDIDRKQLGAIAFSDKSKLGKLNSIVWPHILQLAEAEIQRLAADGVNVVILEAAVLLEAGWDNSVHEVWTTFIPREEAIKRIGERNQLTEEQAAQRVDAQLSNTERIAKSNVVVCPLWEFSYTRKQIQKAWDLLQQRIPVAPPLCRH